MPAVVGQRFLFVICCSVRHSLNSRPSRLFYRAGCGSPSVYDLLSYNTPFYYSVYQGRPVHELAGLEDKRTESPCGFIVTAWYCSTTIVLSRVNICGQGLFLLRPRDTKVRTRLLSRSYEKSRCLLHLLQSQVRRCCLLDSSDSV